MLLVVDVGNTQTHFGVYQGERLLEHWRFATVRQSTADELGAALRTLLELRGYSFADIDASIVSSTVPQLEPEWTAVASRYLAVQLMPAGCVAEDPRVARAYELSRCAVEAFPATAAARDYRQIAAELQYWPMPQASHFEWPVQSVRTETQHGLERSINSGAVRRTETPLMQLAMSSPASV